jgi:hypothetical protein
MDSWFRLTVGLCLLLPFLAGCVPTAEQQAAAFQQTPETTQARSLQSRRFDTSDKNLMLQASIGALQDLGFTIDETQAEHGVVVASKLGGGLIRAQVTIQTISSGLLVRAIFQHIVPQPGAMLPLGTTLTEPDLYRGFFEKLSQSAFLTAHQI